MGLFQYDGMNVFTNPDMEVCLRDIEHSNVCAGSIETAFFSKNVFRDKNFRTPRKLTYRDIRVKDPDSGLILCMYSTRLNGRIPLRFPIYNWDRILLFLKEANTPPENINDLKGRYIDQYYQGNFLLGISLGFIPEVEDKTPKILF